jgi:predicted dehydrogenase
LDAIVSAVEVGGERKSVRAAIIGLGGIAKVHARLIHDLGGELVGVCGRTLQSAEAFGGAAAYSDPLRMLAERRPDVVHVCSPNHLHAEHSIAALQAGAHVLCEKPMATSAADCRRMIAAADRAGRIGAIAYTYRGYPLIEVLRRRVAAGDFGKLRRLAGCYLSQDVFAADKYVWMFTPGTTGPSYALMDLGVHWLHLAEYVSGERIVALSAQFSTHQPRRTWRGLAGEGAQPPGVAEAGGVAVDVAVEDQADLLVRLTGGAAGSVTVSGVSPGRPNTIVLSADGSKLGFEWNQQDPNTYLECGADGNVIRQRSPETMPAERAWMTRLPAGHAEGYVDAFRNVVAQAWSAMRGETGEYPSFADGLRGVSLVEAAVESHGSGRRVEVPA